MGILIGISLSLHIALISLDILAILILSIHEHSMCFRLLCHSFINVLQFQIRSFISLVNIPTYFTLLFDAIINGIAFLIYFSMVHNWFIKCSRFLYINLVFCNFAEFIYSNSFCVCVWNF